MVWSLYGRKELAVAAAVMPWRLLRKTVWVDDCRAAASARTVLMTVWLTPYPRPVKHFLFTSLQPLRTASASATGSHVFLGDCCPIFARMLARMPPSTHRQVTRHPCRRRALPSLA